VAKPPKGETGHTRAGDTADVTSTSVEPATIADVLRELEPMGDLGRFVVDDLAPEEEDDFFRSLEEVLTPG
jgi:hypothetical protein